MKKTPILDPLIKEQLLTHLGIPRVEYFRSIDYIDEATGKQVRDSVTATWIMTFEYQNAIRGLGYCKIKPAYDPSRKSEEERFVFLPLDQLEQQTNPVVMFQELPSNFTEPVSEILKRLSVVQNDDLTDCDENLYHIKMNVYTQYMLSFELQYSGCANKLKDNSVNNFFIAIQDLVNHIVKTTSDTVARKFVENHWWKLL